MEQQAERLKSISCVAIRNLDNILTKSHLTLEENPRVKIRSCNTPQGFLKVHSVSSPRPLWGFSPYYIEINRLEAGVLAVCKQGHRQLLVVYF